MTAAIVVAGGSARRFGGGDKLTHQVDGQPLLGRVLVALRAADAGPIVVVGPPRPGIDDGCVVVREHPPGGGPLAAVAAGNRALAAADTSAGDRPTGRVFVVAGDLPYLTAATLDELRSALDEHAEVDAAHVVDRTGRVQELLALWAVPALAACVAGLGDPAGVAMHRLRAAARGVLVSPSFPPGGPAPWTDLDAPPR